MKITYINVSKPFRYLWLKNIVGVSLSVHCAGCLRGTYSKAVNPNMQHAENIELENGVYYLCGVSKPYVWQNNFHLAFEYCKGETLHYQNNGIEVEIEDAVSLPISEKYIDTNNPHSDERQYRTCRNWQFAHYLKQRELSKSK